MSPISSAFSDLYLQGPRSSNVNFDLRGVSENRSLFSSASRPRSSTGTTVPVEKWKSSGFSTFFGIPFRRSGEPDPGKSGKVEILRISTFPLFHFFRDPVSTIRGSRSRKKWKSGNPKDFHFSSFRLMG